MPRFLGENDIRIYSSTRNDISDNRLLLGQQEQYILLGLKIKELNEKRWRNDKMYLNEGLELGEQQNILTVHIGMNIAQSKSFDVIGWRSIIPDPIHDYSFDLVWDKTKCREQ